MWMDFRDRNVFENDNSISCKKSWLKLVVPVPRQVNSGYCREISLVADFSKQHRHTQFLRTSRFPFSSPKASWETEGETRFPWRPGKLTGFSPVETPANQIKTVVTPASMATPGSQPIHFVLIWEIVALWRPSRCNSLEILCCQCGQPWPSRSNA